MHFLISYYEITLAVTQRCSIKMVFLEISQNLQENTCARVSFFNKVAGFRPATLLKKRPWHKCFPVNVAKFLRAAFLQNTSRRLLLHFSLKVKNVEFRLNLEFRVTFSS